MLNLKDFRKHYIDAMEAKNEEIFIAEPGWEEWMDRYNVDTVVSILRIIYKLSEAGKDVTELRKIYGVSRAEFSRMLGIPLRTIDNWNAKVSMPSEHLFFMIAHEVFINMCMEELWQDLEKI